MLIVGGEICFSSTFKDIKETATDMAGAMHPWIYQQSFYFEHHGDGDDTGFLEKDAAWCISVVTSRTTANRRQGSRDSR